MNELQAKPPPFYHSTDMILQRMKDLAQTRPDIFDISTITLSESVDYEGLLLTRITRHDTLTATSSKHRLLFNFGEHGRELISSEIALAFCEGFADADPSSWAHKLLEKVEFFIVSVQCPWSRRVAETTDSCQRTNANGVDLNRNWDMKFKRHPPKRPKGETYGGKRAFSENESKVTFGKKVALKAFVLRSLWMPSPLMCCPYRLCVMP